MRHGFIGAIYAIFSRKRLTQIHHFTERAWSACTIGNDAVDDMPNHVVYFLHIININRPYIILFE